MNFSAMNIPVTYISAMGGAMGVVLFALASLTLHQCRNLRVTKFHETACASPFDASMNSKNSQRRREINAEITLA